MKITQHCLSDIPERLSRMTRFRPCLKLIFKRYLWNAKGAGVWGSGSVLFCEKNIDIITIIYILMLMYIHLKLPLLTEPSGSSCLFSSKSFASLDNYKKKNMDTVILKQQQKRGDKTLFPKSCLIKCEKLPVVLFWSNA